jgi:hypothetical protein
MRAAIGARRTTPSTCAEGGAVKLHSATEIASSIDLCAKVVGGRPGAR